MFYIYAFSRAQEDYELVGAWSMKADADAHVQKLKSAGEPCVAAIEDEWRNVLDRAVRARLGPIAKALEQLKVISPDPDACRWAAEEHRELKG